LDPLRPAGTSPNWQTQLGEEKSYGGKQLNY